MKQSTKFLLLGVLLIAVLLGAAFGYNYLTGDRTAETPPSALLPGAEEEPEVPLQPAPDFTVTDMEGNPVSLSDFSDKPVILNFWATWCGPCKSEMPHFDAAYRTYGQDIHFVMINLTDGRRDTPERVARFIEKNGYTFPVYLDTTFEASNLYGAYSIPLTVFIDRDGNIAGGQMGALSEQALMGVIEYLLGGETK